MPYGTPPPYTSPTSAILAPAPTPASSSTAPSPPSAREALQLLEKDPHPPALEVDIPAVLNGTEQRTTVMIRNVPNRVAPVQLREFLDSYIRDGYDLMYLPMDFQRGNNFGYCFVNLVHPRVVVPLIDYMMGKRWPSTPSRKVCHINYARIQGRQALCEHFMLETKLMEIANPDWRPVILGSPRARPSSRSSVRRGGGSSASHASSSSSSP
eukprot:Unigene5560_Nuclearia_a/m.16996 Unigene5560_Nuclearia_a/g.16996  ORF Unigene5560_Nuclearia_a/g.16996 Unigene5560_Nuclearia_a/m.16996 type:complete len:211 (+) Unigene5560_Nuclearia_a:273-905(+)